MIAAEMVPMLIEEAKKRKLAMLQKGQESPSVPGGADGKTKDLAPKGRSTEIAGRAVGVGKTSVDSAIILRQFSLKEFHYML